MLKITMFLKVQLKNIMKEEIFFNDSTSVVTYSGG